MTAFAGHSGVCTGGPRAAGLGAQQLQVLRAADKTPYVHTIVGGGDALTDTANGFYAIAQKVSGVPIVLWCNEHFGQLRTAEGNPSWKRVRTRRACRAW